MSRISSLTDTTGLRSPHSSGGRGRNGDRCPGVRVEPDGGEDCDEQPIHDTRTTPSATPLALKGVSDLNILRPVKAGCILSGLDYATDVKSTIRSSDLAHLAHVELLSPKPDESLKFFTDVMGMTESGRRGDSVYLRGWDDYE